MPADPANAATPAVDQFQFQINNKIKSFLVYVPDQATKTSWLTSFAKLLAEKDSADKQKSSHTHGQGTAAAVGAAGGPGTPSASGDPSKQKKAETIAPVWKHDKSEDSCPCCDKKFTFTKRRHHCRKWCGKLHSESQRQLCPCQLD